MKEIFPQTGRKSVSISLCLLHVGIGISGEMFNKSEWSIFYIHNPDSARKHL